MRSRPVTLAVLTVGLATLAMASSAHAAIDPLCGKTIPLTPPFTDPRVVGNVLTLDGDMDCTGITGNILTIGGNGVTIDGQGWKIDAPDAARVVSSAARTNLTVMNLDVSGWCNGDGIYFQGGSGLTVQSVIANGRGNGVYVENSSALTVQNLTADGNQSNGLYINGVATGGVVPVLSGLTLTNNTIGLRINGLTGVSLASPWVIDGATIASLAGSATGIYIENVKNTTIRNLSLTDNPDFGINAISNTSSGLVFENLNLSGPGRGYGLNVVGATNVSLVGVTANNRAYGVWAQNINNLSVQTLIADGANAAAFYLVSPTLPLALSDLRLTNSAVGFQAQGVNGLLTASPRSTLVWDATTFTNLAGNNTAFNLNPGGNKNLTIQGLTLPSPVIGINAFSASNSDLVLQNLDLSGPGRGVGLQIQGANHTLKNITANYRAIAINPSSCPNLKLIDLTIDGATSYALLLQDPTLPLLIQNVKATNSNIGVYVSGFNGLITASPRTTFIFDPTALSLLTGNDTTIYFGGSVTNVTVQGLTLPGYAYGLRGESTSNNNNLYQNLDLSGPGAGYGMYIGGVNNTIKDVTANHRAPGVYAVSTASLRVENLTSDRNSGTAFVLDTPAAGATTLPTLINLKLTNSVTGFQMSGPATSLAPFTLDATALTDLRGNATSIAFSSSVKGVTVKGLSLDGASYGIDARSTTNAGLTFDTLDVSSANNGGLGLWLGGADHLVKSVTARNRNWGLYLGGGTNLQIQNVTADGNTTGLYLNGITAVMTPPVLTNVKLINNGTALTLETITGPSVAAPWVIDGSSFSDLSGNDAGILTSSGVKNVTFKNLTLRTPNTGIQASGTLDSDLTFDNVDVSGFGGGNGIDVRGTNAKLVNVTANRRNYGALVGSANAKIDRFTADSATTAGLYLFNYTPTTLPTQLTNLALTNSYTGLLLDTVDGLTIGAGSITNLAGSAIGIRFSSSVKNTIIQDLTLPARLTGIDANAVSNSANTFRRLDLSASAHATGTGIYVNGTNHVIDAVTANRRSNGIVVVGSGHTVQSSIIDAASTYGLYVSGAVPLTLANNTITNSTRGVWFQSFTGAFNLDATKLTSLAGSVPAIRIDGSPNVTVSNAALGVAGPVSSEWSLPAPTAVTVPGNPTCGATLTANTMLVADLDCSNIMSGSALAIGANGVALDGAGFSIKAPNADYAINTAGYSNVTVQNIKIAGARGKSQGVRVTNGSNNAVIDVTTDRQGWGVYTSGVSGLTVTNLVATGSISAGLYVGSPATLPTLSNLKLTNNGLGLQMDTFTGPYTIDGTALTAINGNATSIQFGGNVKNVTVTGLTLDGFTTGLNASASTNANMTLTHLNVSGVATGTDRGTGINIYGAGHMLEDVVANSRHTGINAGTTSGGNGVSSLVLRRIKADSNAANGIVLSNVTLPLTLVDLELTNNMNSGLYMDNFNGAYVDGLGVAQKYTLDAAALKKLEGNAYGIAFNGGNVKNVVVSGLTLSNRTGGINANAATNADLTFKNLNLSGPGRGVGLNLQGTGHLIEDVVSNTRDSGVEVASSTNLTVRRLTTDNNRGNGLYLVSPTQPLTLEALKLRKTGGNGFYLSTFTGPYTFNAANFAELSGNSTDLNFGGNVKTGIVVSGLTLPGYSNGINSNATTNDGITFQNLNVSGPQRGNGIVAAGANMVLKDITANHRGSGVYTLNASKIRLENISTDRSSIGIDFERAGTAYVAGYLAPTLINLKATNATHGLYLNGISGLSSLTIDPSVLTDVTGTANAVTFDGVVNNVTVEGLTLPNRNAGVSVNSISVANCTFRDLDVSGPGRNSGLVVRGPNHVVRDIDAHHRGIGVYAISASNLRLEDIRSSQSGTGVALANMKQVYVNPVAYTPPTLIDLELTNNATGLDITTLSGPLTIDPTVLTASGGNATPLLINDSTSITVRNLTLSGVSTGVNASYSTNSGLLFEDIDTSGVGLGNGINIAGTNHTLRRITANKRSIGVQAAAVNNLVVDTLTADNASSIGLYLLNTSTGTAPTLTNIKSRNSATAVSIASWSLPFTLGPGSLVDATGSSYGVTIVDSRNVTLSGLTLPNRTGGIFSSNVEKLTFSNVDVTGQCNGTGLSISGNNVALASDYTISGVTAAKRATGLLIGNGDGFVITNSVFGGNGNGISIGGRSNIPFTTVVNDVTNTASRFKIGDQSYFVVGQTLRVNLAGGAEDRVITAITSFFVTLDAPLSVIPPTGTVVQGPGFGTKTRVVMNDSDVCANATGVTANAVVTTATGNYWRATTGPRHASVAGGTGDLVTGSAIALSPFVSVPKNKTNVYCNQAPVPNAGLDRTVCEDDLVVLDGSASFDPDDEPLSYDWSQIFGPTVTLMPDPNPAIAKFYASVGQTLTFELLGFALTVADDVVTRSDTVNINVQIRNKLPAADAGGDLQVNEGASVQLAGSGTDPENQPLSYQWVQVGGPSVTLTGASSAVPTFTAPAVGPGGGIVTETLTFQLTVTDVQPPSYCGGSVSGTDTVQVIVGNVNTSPVADAGDTQTVFEDDAVTLDGSGSTDPDGDALLYAWNQTGGSTVLLSDASSSAPTFTAPTQVPGGQETLTFSLVVDDTFGGVSTASSVSVVVKDRCAITGDDNDCDGLDSDCDGAVDNHYVPDTSCFLPGACAAGNVASSCGVGGAETLCQAGSATGVSEAECNGVDDDCDSQVDEDYVSLVTSCGVGACVSAGATSCVNGNVANSCAAGTPAADDTTCDGIDDDCNNIVDDGYVSLVTSCGTGACASAGTTSCVLGDEVDSCSAGTPAASDTTCDGVDDDCNNIVDDGYVSLVTSCGTGACASAGTTSCVLGDEVDSCSAGTPAASDTTCDGVDDDCNNIVDDGYVSLVTSCGTGACASAGTTSCVLGDEVDSCTAGTPAASDTTCDGVDDDCNNIVDDGYVSIVTSCGVGACASAGTTSCVLGDEVDSCTAGTPAADDATCDGIDDDCSGTADEDYVSLATSCGVGACAATGATSCVAGDVANSCTAGTPADDDTTCDGIDDDCSGTADEDYVSLATSCGVGACAATGATSCVAGDVANSCAAGTPAADDATCDGIDDDCSGTADEDYVSLATSCGVGACASAGTTSCVLGDEVDSCTAGTPAADDTTCDGVDDDCNNIVDDGYVSLVTSCGVGACASAGTTSCVLGDEVDSCNAGTPAADDTTCDGVDDDCNNIVDDGYVSLVTSCGVGACASAGTTSCVLGDEVDSCTAGIPAADDTTCDGVDDDCNNIVDDGYVSLVTSCGTGACASAGTTSCVLGDEVDSCTAGTPAADDTTCDGVDDDCNNIVDDGYVSLVTSCGTGACASAGSTSCVLGDEVDSCSAGTPAADDTTCDGVDDDCNNIVDDGYVSLVTSCGVGACASAGTTSCVLGDEVDSCSAGTPAADDATCDGVDDDCSGTADEDYVQAPTACGAGSCTGVGQRVCSLGDEVDTCVIPTADADADLTPDCADDCPLDPTKVLAGQCGCATLDLDPDMDGTATCNDGCPDDAAKLSPGTCGCGTPDDDVDNDQVVRCLDNCPVTANSDQLDFDADGAGDECDTDDDNDTILDVDDNCHFVPNPGQTNTDGASDGGDDCDLDDDNDGFLDVDDNCQFVPNQSQINTDDDPSGDECDDDDDNDGILDIDDNCRTRVNVDQVDTDGDNDGDLCDRDDDNDGIDDRDDNCPLIVNGDQDDNDEDGDGDLCDNDDDNDGILDTADNCQFAGNPDQANFLLLDTRGDVCDDDDDNDGVPDVTDNCHFGPNPDQLDTNLDGQGDVCDDDDDNDGILDTEDLCPTVADPYQTDTDGDGQGDACDGDDDGDEVLDIDDGCPVTPDPLQDDFDGDGIGDVCDDDRDGDDVADVIDNCLPFANNAQTDTDLDGQGDVCDDDDDGDDVLDVDDGCPLVPDPAQTDTDLDGLGDACDDDDDGDGVLDTTDNCPLSVNSDQGDNEQDGGGDVCDLDDDNDGILDTTDNCPLAANGAQADNELDGIGDVCDPDDDNDGIGDGTDNCPIVPNVGQVNLDGDGLGDACDADRDGDGVLNVLDNCPEIMNGDQADFDGDGLGNACDGDLDGDGIVNGLDNCPVTPNADQANLDLDGQGDACDPDVDGDSVVNTSDNCPRTPNTSQGDNEADGQGDACDSDDDNDGRLDGVDNCPLAANPSQANNDGDSKGDVCDPDDDNDGVPDTTDNCPFVANVGQTNTDGDSQGNTCDPDDDNDTILDSGDNCPLDPNTSQADGDDDGIGDVCDNDDDDDGVADGTDICPDTPAEPPTMTVIDAASYCRNRGHDNDDDDDDDDDVAMLPVDPANGCSVEQLCPCAGPRGQNTEWNNHGDYVSCVTAATNSMARRHLISNNQKSDYIEEAAESECGKNPCQNNKLRNQSYSSAPRLVLEIPTFQPWGSTAPTSRKVFAGTTQIFPDADGRYVVPLVNTQNKVIVDSLTASGVQSSTALPKGAFFVLRTGDGNVVTGLKGYFGSGHKVAMEVVTKVVNGKKGNEKNITFEGQGNGFAVLGVASEDEFWREVLQVRMKTTVTTKADLMSFQVCK